MPKQTVLIELRKGEKANGYITMKGMLRDTPKDRAKTCVKKLKPSTASQTLKKREARKRYRNHWLTSELERLPER